MWHGIFLEVCQQISPQPCIYLTVIVHGYIELAAWNNCPWGLTTNSGVFKSCQKLAWEKYYLGRPALVTYFFRQMVLHYGRVLGQLRIYKYTAAWAFSWVLHWDFHWDLNSADLRWAPNTCIDKNLHGWLVAEPMLRITARQSKNWSQSKMPQWSTQVM
jgi:hypothetical protein